MDSRDDTAFSQGRRHGSYLGARQVLLVSRHPTKIRSRRYDGDLLPLEAIPVPWALPCPR